MGNGIDSPGHPADNHKFRLCLSKFKDEAFGMLQPISAAGTGTNESKTGFSGQTFDSFPVKHTGRTLYFLICKGYASDSGQYSRVSGLSSIILFSMAKVLAFDADAILFATLELIPKSRTSSPGVA